MEICYSPLVGKAVNLDHVADEMFSQRMLGDGMAIAPEAREVYSPVAGEITMVYETQHAIGIKTETGIEILLHIGIDTVMLGGNAVRHQGAGRRSRSARRSVNDRGLELYPKKGLRHNRTGSGN